ncbi:MAG TPA: DUF2946 family protein [Limnobacter sp.]|uniref:DUF2946 family protein n=1 Tax=Limnobacter sp. TaxID=2003368 RepID=UPI002E345099|nr:DUF2946 family protein [Limnobacter sp.]HEX5485233.1 DUF2946 family protein [Limnobacter sp.]
MKHALRLLWSRLLLAALIFGALAPTVSRIAFADQAQTWLEVCSVTGPKKILLPGSVDEQPKAHTGSIHCPFCLVQHLLPALLTGDLPKPHLALLPTFSSAQQAARPVHPVLTHSLPPPRAPPISVI